MPLDSTIQEIEQKDPVLIRLANSKAGKYVVYTIVGGKALASILGCGSDNAIVQDDYGTTESNQVTQLPEQPYNPGFKLPD